MGKAARNERVKLDATFLNNLAVGLVLAGIFLPLFSLFRSGRNSSLCIFRNGGSRYCWGLYDFLGRIPI